MARSFVEIVQDDLTGEAIADGAFETIQFAVNGKGYSIDLSAANAAEFHDQLNRYIAVAAKLPKLGAPEPRTRRQLAAIRAWAHDHGYAVSTRGRISAEVIEAYENR